MQLLLALPLQVRTSCTHLGIETKAQSQACALHAHSGSGPWMVPVRPYSGFKHALALYVRMAGNGAVVSEPSCVQTGLLQTENPEITYSVTAPVLHVTRRENRSLASWAQSHV